jgi:hypothetical protein
VPRFELVALVLLARLVGALKGNPGLAPDLNELREFVWGWAAVGYPVVMHARLVRRSSPARAHQVTSTAHG